MTRGEVKITAERREEKREKREGSGVTRRGMHEPEVN